MQEEKRVVDNEIKNDVEREKPIDDVCVEKTDLPSKPEGSDDPVAVETEKKEDARIRRVRSILLYLLFILVNAAVIAVFLIREDKSGDRALFSDVCARLGQNVFFAVLSLVSFLLIVLCDVGVFNLVLYKLGYRNRSVLATKAAIYGRYYDKITPWSIGGEPFQIGYLTYGGLRAGESCAVTMSRHILRFFTTAIVVVVILIASRISTNVWVMAAAILSVSFGLIVPSIMLLCALKPIVGQKIGEFLIALFSRIKIIKDPEKPVKKLRENIEKFSLGVQFLTKNKWVVPTIAAAALIELFLTNAVPFFVMRSFGYADTPFWHTFVLCIFVTYASSFAPTPGGAGLAELSFYAIFATVIPDGYLFWAVLFWRVAVFYLPVLVGFLLHLFDSVKGIARSVGRK